VPRLLAMPLRGWAVFLPRVLPAGVRPRVALFRPALARRPGLSRWSPILPALQHIRPGCFRLVLLKQHPPPPNAGVRPFERTQESLPAGGGCGFVPPGRWLVVPAYLLRAFDRRSSSPCSARTIGLEIFPRTGRRRSSSGCVPRRERGTRRTDPSSALGGRFSAYREMRVGAKGTTGSRRGRWLRPAPSRRPTRSTRSTSGPPAPDEAFFPPVSLFKEGAKGDVEGAQGKRLPPDALCQRMPPGLAASFDRPTSSAEVISSARPTPIDVSVTGPNLADRPRPSAEKIPQGSCRHPVAPHPPVRPQCLSNYP